MATKTIDANMLAKMFLAGAQNIEAKKEYPVINNEYPDLRLEKPAKDEGYIYKESKIWLAYQRCVNKHIITIWNKKILQYETTGDTNKLLDDIIDADLLNDEN